MSSPSNFELKFYGHASFLLTSGPTRLLCDPWFHSADYGSWYPSPYNRHLQAELIAQPPTHIYISHSHEDHLDPKFLSRLNPNIAVVAAAFSDGEMEAVLSTFSNVTFLPHGAVLPLQGMILQMHLDLSTGKNDSALLMDVNGYRILNVNDCYLEPDAVPPCDMLWGQFSGAIHYPHAYDFPAQTQRAKVEEFKARAYRDVMNKVGRSQCSVFVPSAGPPCFLDPSQEHFNDPDATIFYPWQHFSAQFGQDAPNVEVMTLSPGDSCVHEQDTWSVKKAEEVSPSLEEYRKDTVDERLVDYDNDHIKEEELELYFDQVRRSHMHIFAIQQKCFLLVVSGQTYYVSLSSSKRCVYPRGTQPNWMQANTTMWVPSVLMRKILAGHHWENALSSGRIRLHRDEDVFDSILFQVLHQDFSPGKTKSLAKTLRGEVEMMQRDGMLIQRFCPHAGIDLKNAPIVDGIIECPRHNWQWSLATGECVRGGKIGIACRLAGKQKSVDAKMVKSQEMQ